MFNTLYGEQTDRALEAQARLGRDEPKADPGWFAGVPTAIATAVPAAGLEVGRALVNVIDSYADSQVYGATGRDMPASEAGEPYLSQKASQALKWLEPDPETDSTAAQVVHGFGKFAGKAVGYGLLMGPSGAVALGADETLNEDVRLQQQGVDPATRGAASLVHGVAMGASAAVPVLGKTIKGTVGLALTGGPAAFMAEEAAINRILEGAGYSDLAARHDPFDPLGLVLSTAAPLAMGLGLKAAASGRVKMPRELVDAARVRLASRRAQGLAGDTVSAKELAAHEQGVKSAADAIQQGKATQPPDMAEVAVPAPDPVAARAEYQAKAAKIEGVTPEIATKVGEHFEIAARDKPKFDDAVGRIAQTVGGRALRPALKSVERSVEKAMVDYGGDISKLKDAVRATIEVRSAEDAVYALDQVRAEFGDLEGVRNHLAPDSEPLSVDGYRDIKANVRLESGQMAEIQINTPEMLAAKDKAHKLYEGVRSIKAKAQMAGRQLTEAEAGEVARLEAEMAGDYAAAWAEATAARKAASESSEPLRRKESYGNDRGALGSGPSVNDQALQSGSRGAADTSTPSTSANRVPSGNESGSRMGASLDDSSIPGTESPGVDAVQQAAADVLATSPDMVIELDDGTKVSAAEALRQADAEVAQAETDSGAFRAAVSCLLRTGG